MIVILRISLQVVIFKETTCHFLDSNVMANGSRLNVKPHKETFSMVPFLQKASDI